MKIQYVGYTHSGKVRENNEDNFCISGKYKHDVGIREYHIAGNGEDCCFFAAVCDGMGGEAKGEDASLIAVRHLKGAAADRIHEVANQSILDANAGICDLIKSNQGGRSGSTIAVVYIDSGKAVGCNIGDSRIYFCRNGELEQISTDHNQAQRMVDLGIITPEEARDFKGKHTLTQHLGIFPEEMILSPAFSEEICLREDDLFLICSDGLTDMLEDKEMEHIIRVGTSLEKMREQLVNLALHRGGRDNVTVVLLKMEKS